MAWKSFLILICLSVLSSLALFKRWDFFALALVSSLLFGVSGYLFDKSK